MDTGWNAPIPSSLHDGPGMLCVCLAWCVWRRITEHEKALQKQQPYIKRVTQRHPLSSQTGPVCSPYFLMVAHLIPYLRSMLWQAYARVAGIGAPCCHSCIVAIVARIAESATSAAGGYSQ